MVKSKKGFSLIELLVVMAIIAVLVTISIFGMQGAREAGRDGRRKSDLEAIRAGLELYKADCNSYPNALPAGGTLVGTSGSATAICSTSNVYIREIPRDPASPTRTYSYSRPNATTYNLCASLEQAPNPPGSTAGCGGCGQACNYRVTNP